MADLRELYQQTILEHNRSPRNVMKLGDAIRTAEGNNPLCGDHITLYVRLDGDVIGEIGFQGSGCAISQASASLMTAAVQGKTASEAETLFHQFHDMVAGGPEAPADPKTLGKLAAFAGGKEFPARVKCANLSSHTLHPPLPSQPSLTTPDPPPG